MSDRDVVLKLARVVIAVAWVDGEITNEEINSLKDLLFRLRQSAFDDTMQLSAREWSRLEMYIESPVDAAERARLVADLQNALTSADQKRMAIEALQNLVEADGDLTDEEKKILAETARAIESVDVGFMGGLERLVGGAMRRRSQAVANAPNRELFFDDFIRNKVYYTVSERLSIDATELNIPEDQLRKLSLAGGLMAKIAHLDREVTDTEFASMVEALQKNWQTDNQAATFVAEVATSAIDATYDTYRMMREFQANTTHEERCDFLVVLFEVAAADGDIAIDEAEEIRLMSRGLNLTHKDFIDAKMKVQGREPAD